MSEKDDAEMLSQLDMLMEFDVVAVPEGTEFFENMEDAESDDDADAGEEK